MKYWPLPILTGRLSEQAPEVLDPLGQPEEGFMSFHNSFQSWVQVLVSREGGRSRDKYVYPKT